jgi:hypothetical protein
MLNTLINYFDWFVRTFDDPFFIAYCNPFAAFMIAEKSSNSSDSTSVCNSPNAA